MTNLSCRLITRIGWKHAKVKSNVVARVIYFNSRTRHNSIKMYVFEKNGITTNQFDLYVSILGVIMKKQLLKFDSYSIINKQIIK